MPNGAESVSTTAVNRGLASRLTRPAGYKVGAGTQAARKAASNAGIKPPSIGAINKSLTNYKRNKTKISSERRSRNAKRGR